MCFVLNGHFLYIAGSYLLCAVPNLNLLNMSYDTVNEFGNIHIMHDMDNNYLCMYCTNTTNLLRFVQSLIMVFPVFPNFLGCPVMGLVCAFLHRPHPHYPCCLTSIKFNSAEETSFKR